MSSSPDELEIIDLRTPSIRSGSPQLAPPWQSVETVTGGGPMLGQATGRPAAGPRRDATR